MTANHHGKQMEVKSPCLWQPWSSKTCLLSNATLSPEPFEQLMQLKQENEANSEATCSHFFYRLFARLLYSSTTSFHSASRPKDAHGLYWHWIARFLVVFKQQFMQVSWLCSSNSSCNNSCNIHATIHATINETINETISDTMHTWKLEIKSAKYLPHHRCTEQFGFSRKH